MASKASSATVGTGEEDVICHFESKYDEYCILIWEVFLFFFNILRKKCRTTVAQGSAKLCHIYFYKSVLK